MQLRPREVHHFRKRKKNEKEEASHPARGSQERRYLVSNELGFNLTVIFSLQTFLGAECSYAGTLPETLSGRPPKALCPKPSSLAASYHMGQVLNFISPLLVIGKVGSVTYPLLRSAVRTKWESELGALSGVHTAPPPPHGLLGGHFVFLGLWLPHPSVCLCLHGASPLCLAYSHLEILNYTFKDPYFT